MELQVIPQRLEHLAKQIAHRVSADGNQIRLLSEPVSNDRRTWRLEVFGAVTQNEFRVCLRANDGSNLRSWFRIQDERAILKALQVTIAFSGDPDGPTTPIGMPEPYELPEAEIAAFNISPAWHEPI